MGHAVDDADNWFEGDERRSSSSTSDFNWDKTARLICAVLLPPLGVFLQTGCNKDLAINALLTLFGYVPGIIHAVYVICVS
ncbi:Protein Ric1 [Phytophthora cinnamomi]|uniref:Protein Ric1 n=1 Tax=Phytophthora cinnamomi TaxID=4785 RepID=UPI003559824D|nr:Protein Ric1 [Phytophthora cinnamomi]